MQGAVLIFMGFAFLGQVYSTGNIIHGLPSTIVNGTQGKVSTISTYIPKNKIATGNCRCQWFRSNETIDNSYGHFKYFEDRSTGTFSMEINSTQRTDAGHYKIVCCDNIESQETFLNVIEFPSKEYPTVEFEVKNGLLVVKFIREKLSPIPELTLNGKKHILYKNATHFWINKTVQIISDITNETYICVLYLKGYYRQIKAINGSQLAEYWNNIVDGSPDEEDTPPDNEDTPPDDEGTNPNEKDNLTSLTLGLKITGVTVGVILIIVCLCISIYLLIKSQNKNKNYSVGYTAVSGHLSINLGTPISDRGHGV